MKSGKNFLSLGQVRGKFSILRASKCEKNNNSVFPIQNNRIMKFRKINKP